MGQIEPEVSKEVRFFSEQILLNQYLTNLIL